jgi:hypothetical protein
MYTAMRTGFRWIVALVASASIAPSLAVDGLGVVVNEIGACANTTAQSMRSEIQSVTREGRILVVSVLASAACGGEHPDEPDVKVSGSVVALSWSWLAKRGVPVTAACVCVHRLEFQVSGIPPGEFTVTAEPRASMSRTSNKSFERTTPQTRSTWLGTAQLDR